MSENVNQENKQEQENTDTPETQPLSLIHI